MIKQLIAIFYFTLKQNYPKDFFHFLLLGVYSKSRNPQTVI